MELVIVTTLAIVALALVLQADHKANKTSSHSGEEDNNW